MKCHNCNKKKVKNQMIQDKKGIIAAILVFLKNLLEQLKGGKQKTMTNLRESAKAYMPPQTRNIAELEAVSLDVPITEKKGINKEGQEFSFHVATVAGEEYRVPSSVLGDIKAIMTAKPSLKTIKVIKKGQGMNTSYTVVPLE